MNPTTPEKLTAVTLAVFRLNGLLVEWGNRFSQPHGLTSARWQVMSKPWFALVKGRRDGLVGAKLRRMPWIAANGVLVLSPSALLLAHKASAGAFDGTFYAVQALELTAGAVNIVLLGLNMRDGLRMTARRRG